MSTRAQRKQRRRDRSCPGCGQYKARHYVPPSAGDEGFYICNQTLRDGKAVTRAGGR